MLFHKKTKIYDCFMFFNEIEMLQFRLKELYNEVDYFVIVEATKGFTGKNKSLYYKENCKLFENFKNKIIHVVVDDLKKDVNPWINESYQRNSLKRGLINIASEDILLLGDVDEIPNKNSFEKIKTYAKINDFVVLVQDMFYYNTNCFVSEWISARALTYKSFQNFKNDAHEIRLTKLKNKNVHFEKDGGWHFSYFGNAKKSLEKIRNFSHQEYNNENITEEHIQNCINLKIDLFHRELNKISPSCLSRNFQNTKCVPQRIQKELNEFFNN